MKFLLAVLSRLIQCFEIPVPSKDIRSVLVIDPNHIGDMLLSSPVYRALKENIPAARVDALIYPFAQIGLEGNPYIDNIHLLPKGALYRQAGILLKMRKRKYGLVLQLNTSLRTNFLMWIMGRRYRMGYDYANRGCFNNIRIPIGTRTARTRYRVDESLDLMEKAFGWKISERSMVFHIGRESQDRVDQMLVEMKAGRGGLLIGLHPHFRRTWAKEPEWEPEKFSQLIDSLVEKYNAKIAISGVGEDMEYNQRVINNSKYKENILNFVGRLSFQEMGALLRRVKIFITVNTSPMHVAISQNTPTIALMRATPPVITFPAKNPRFQYLVGKSEKPYDPLKLDYERGSAIHLIEVKDVLMKVEEMLSYLESERNTR